MDSHSVILLFKGLIIIKKLFIFVLCILLLSGCSDTSTVGSDAIYENLSEKKEGWGFRRTEEGPEFSENQIRQMNEYGCIHRESSGEKNIFLTFDEGYENGYTSIILDTLREKDVKAAFFVTGDFARRNPTLIKRMIDEGHIVGNHTLNHPSLPEIKDTEKLLSELHELDRLICNLGGERCKYLRPPKGEYSERTLAVTRDDGYTNVFWSQAYVDWNNDTSKSEAFEKVTSSLHDGCVLLLHAVSKGNAEALGDIIDHARKNGYSFKPLDSYKFPT